MPVKFAIAFCAAAMGAACASAPPQRAAFARAQNMASPAFTSDAALADVNAYRRAQGVGAVRIDAALMNAAAAHSRAMLSAGVMSHDVGGGFEARLAAAGIGPAAAVENVAAGQKSLAEVMEGWKRSPGHAANLRNAAMTRMGIAAAGGYWTLIMAGEGAQGGRAAR
jgi:uncharacterized protein YkwD